MTENPINPPRNRQTVFRISGKKIVADDERYDPVILSAMGAATYESGERNVLPKLLHKGDRVIEIGTAVGLVAMCAADIVGEQNVFCFEANSSLVKHATRNFAFNGMSIDIHNMVLLPLVAWPGENTYSDFFVHKEFWASSLANRPGTIGVEKVENACIEQAISRFHANTIICDIEGGEIDLLSFANLRGVEKILVEIHYSAGRAAINKMIRKLIIDGFSIDFDLSGRSIVVFRRGLA